MKAENIDISKLEDVISLLMNSGRSKEEIIDEAAELTGCPKYFVEWAFV